MRWVRRELFCHLVFKCDTDLNADQIKVEYMATTRRGLCSWTEPAVWMPGGVTATSPMSRVIQISTAVFPIFPALSPWPSLSL